MKLIRRLRLFQWMMKLDVELDNDTVLVDDGNVQIGETGERQTGEKWKCADCAC